MVSARPTLGELGWATIEFHERIASTSDRARELLHEGAALPAIVAASRQSRGRGRRGRRWESDTDQGLWFTLVRSDLPAAADPILPLRTGLALVRALEALLHGAATRPPPHAFPPLQIKWPNDILADGAKLAGILCERTGGAALIGIGVNLNQCASTLPAAPVPPATSLRLLAGHRFGRGAALTTIVHSLQTLSGGFPSIPPSQPHIPPSELAELNARSALGRAPLTVTGALRNPGDGTLREVTRAVVTAGPIHPDGTLEVLDASGTALHLVAGSATPSPVSPSPEPASLPQ